ncbi:MAG: helix-turn-helix domain-containing protein [Bdellovibrionales bacterium]
MTTEEAAHHLRISPATLRNLTSNGEIPYYKFGRRNRYLRCDLNQLLSANKRGGFLWEQSLTKRRATGRHIGVSATQSPENRKA